MKMKSVLRRIFFITLPSIFIFLIILELTLRIGGNLYTRYRNPEIYSKATVSNSGAFTILCMGDSYTEGFGASITNSYPRKLELLLQEGGLKNIAVLNIGRGGNSSSLLLKKLSEDIDKYRPNMIVIMIGGNNYWNLEQSNYFILCSKWEEFRLLADKILSSLKIYKLLKIGWINFKSKVYKNDRSIPTKYGIHKINRKSEVIKNEGVKLIYMGDFNLAMGKFKNALTIDKNNYGAHFWLAHIYISFKSYDLAKEEIWQAINLMNEDDVLSYIYRIVDLAIRLRDKDCELGKLNNYFKNKYVKNKELIKIIGEVEHLLKEQNMRDKVLAYDLREITRFINEKGIRLILQSYPQESPWYANKVVRKIANEYSAPFVDNEKIFKERLKYLDRATFFVSDGHCNAQGYGIIAENIYNALVKYKLLPDNKEKEARKI